MKTLNRILCLLCLTGCLAASASAQNFYWNSASPRSQAMGGVYVPSSTDAIDALAANPAGLTALSAPTLSLGMTGVLAGGSFSNSVNSNSPMDTHPGVIPFGAFGSRIKHSRFTLGAGFIPDLASEANWHYVDAPGVAGATYGLQTNKSEIIAGRLIAGVGMNVNRYLAIGATFGADYNRNTLITPYIFQENSTLAGLKTLLNLHTSGWGYNGSIGALISPTRKLQLGVAWRSGTVITSNGAASGDARAQFDAVGFTGVPSTFNYSASVLNHLPQSALASVSYLVKQRWLVAFQGDFVNWGNSFVNLPVTLTNGNNAAINGLLGSTTLVDGVPLNWHNQYKIHAGAERTLTERMSMRVGYQYQTDPVPSSTLTPMTAAIMTNTFSAGMVYRMGKQRFEATYAIAPMRGQSVGQSGLLSGEYNNSNVRIGLQSLTTGYSIQF